MSGRSTIVLVPYAVVVALVTDPIEERTGYKEETIQYHYRGITPDMVGVVIIGAGSLP